MKQILVLITIFSFGLSVEAQISAQNFDRVPDNNLMVEQSLEILERIRNGDLEKLCESYKIELNSRDSIDRIKHFIEHGVIEDTIMNEFYNHNPRTEISFKLNCNDLKNGLTYWIKINADGINGSIDNMKIRIEEDYSYMKTKSEIEDLLNGI